MMTPDDYTIASVEVIVPHCPSLDFLIAWTGDALPTSRQVTDKMIKDCGLRSHTGWVEWDPSMVAIVRVDMVDDPVAVVGEKAISWMLCGAMVATEPETGDVQPKMVRCPSCSAVLYIAPDRKKRALRGKVLLGDLWSGACSKCGASWWYRRTGDIDAQSWPLVHGEGGEDASG